MPIIKNQKKLYRFALDNKFIIPGFNIYDLESLRAVLSAAEETDSPVAVQISYGTYKNLAPIDSFVGFFFDIAEKCKVPVMLHHDYLPDLESCKYAVDIGFQSVSFNGQMLPFEENMRISAQVADYAHSHGAIAEAELGNVPGDGFAASDVYTDPQQAAEFVKRTGVDALAVSVGTSHGGLRRDKPLEIRYDLLDEISKAVEGTPLILHGAASRPRAYTERVNAFGGEVEYLSMATEEGVSEARNHGVAKIYADMDNWLSVTGALREYLSENKGAINPIQYMPLCGEAMKRAIIEKLEKVTKGCGCGKRFIEKCEG